MNGQPTTPPVPEDSDWWPCRVTSVPSAGQYLITEVWLVGGVITDKTGGRFNTSSSPAYAIDGSTFAATSAGSSVQVLARKAVGSGGIGWELKGFGGDGLLRFSVADSIALIGGAAEWMTGSIGQMVRGGVAAGQYYLSLATGTIDRTGLAATQVRIGFVASSTSPLPAGLAENGWIIQSCPANSITAFCITANFVLVTGPYLGVAIETMAGGVPTGGAVPPNWISNWSLIQTGAYS